MTLALVCTAVAVLCMPFWLGPLARRLDPNENVRLSAAAILLGTLLVEVSLVVLAAPVVSGALGTHSEMIGLCLFGDGSFGGLFISWTAAAFAVLFPVLWYQAWLRTKCVTAAMRAEATLGLHRQIDGIDLVRLPTASLVAYSIDGPDPQIVVSDGLVNLLADDELDLVVSHEVAHLRAGHGTVLRLLTALETPMPSLRWITTSVRVAIERSADEAAIRKDPARRSTLLDAILKVSAADVPMSVPAFTRRSGVVERAEALIAVPPTPTSFQLVATRFALGGAAVAGVMFVCGSAFATHAMFCLSHICCG